MADIVLTTLNAKYIHASFGLRYLLANMGDLRARTEIAEFDINQRPLDIVERLVARRPRILGFGVYIWNAVETYEVVVALRKILPDLVIVLGGPEVSYETESQPLFALAHYIVTGEADLAFAELCAQLLEGRPPERKIVPSPLPDFSRLQLPYELYTEADIAHRVIYIEASRGCPFSCEFCLSSLDIPVRQVPLERLLSALQVLLDRGVTQFKFVDRTFNLNLQFSLAILSFFLERYRPGLFFHFEMIPDRLPAGLREIIARFPPGALQFEVGIQSFNDEVCALISRRQDYGRLEDNFRFLRGSTGVHLHADLIVGLPGETIDSFAEGFNRLVALDPQEIQVGLLKRLRGTPIVRHDREWAMCYHELPPYELLQNRLLDFATVQRLKRFGKYWDLTVNSGNFSETVRLIWSVPSLAQAQDQTPEVASPFHRFLAFSDWLHGELGRTDSIALPRLAEMLFRYLTSTTNKKFVPAFVAESLARDWARAGRKDPPAFLRSVLPSSDARPSKVSADASAPSQSAAPLPKRQARHWPGTTTTSA